MSRKLLCWIALALIAGAAPTSAQSPGLKRQRTISVSTVSTSGSVAAGKHFIRFETSGTFAGTVGGVTYAANTKVEFPYLPVDTYSTLAYTITAGAATLTTF